MYLMYGLKKKISKGSKKSINQFHIRSKYILKNQKVVIDVCRHSTKIFHISKTITALKNSVEQESSICDCGHLTLLKQL